MCLLLLKALTLTLLSGSLTIAFEGISISTTVAAGANIQVQIVNDLSKGPNSFDGQFDSYRVFLSLSPPGWDTVPACFLVNSSAINVTSQTIQIPASVGPSDSSHHGYALATLEFNQDPIKNGGLGALQLSHYFAFTGGTGQWSQYELSGYIVLDPNYIPCTAYDCARQCSQKYYPADTNGHNEGALNSTYVCISQCPGVSLPPFDSIYDGGGGNPSPSSTLGGISGVSFSSTSLAAQGGFTQIHTSTGVTSPSSTAASGLSSSTLLASLTSTGVSTPSATKSAANRFSPPLFAVVAAGLVFFATLIEI